MLQILRLSTRFPTLMVQQQSEKFRATNRQLQEGENFLRIFMLKLCQGVLHDPHEVQDLHWFSGVIQVT